MAILLFLLVLFVLVLVHEWGHFIVAKKTGMRVDEFGIGFPPKLFGVKKGETEYTFNALPIGGFVKIFGEDAEGAKDRGDYNRSFAAKSKWAQAAVLLAGVTMNIIFAWFLYVIVFMVGVPTAVDPTEATPAANLLVADVLPEGPAAAAGIPVGAEITALSSGSEQATALQPTPASTFIAEHETLSITYQVNEETKTVTLSPTAGTIEAEPERAAIGVAFVLVDTVQQPFFAALQQASVTTYQNLIAITVGLGSLVVDSVRGAADFSQVAGPVGIVGMVGDAANFGLTSLLLFTAVISLNLAVINLLPFPALDGGRLLFVLIETVIRRPINPAWVGRLNLLGFALLILLMVAVTYNDILRIV